MLMITAFASVETAISAMKLGAFDYITKPFKNDEVLGRGAQRGGASPAEGGEHGASTDAAGSAGALCGIIGRSARMKQVFNLIIQAAPSRSTILITGESGTGKELVARAIHAHSSRADRAFVTVNSGNLPSDLLESTLFGHVKGAFTVRSTRRRGCVTSPIAAASSSTRSATFRSTRRRSCCASCRNVSSCDWGGMETIKVDVRIIAATNCDLREMVGTGRFREDLYYRLHVINISLPPLRERREDVPSLAQHFLEK